MADDDTLSTPDHPPVILVRKVHTEAVLPFKSDASAAGFDLSLLEAKVIGPGEVALLRTGISAMPPPGAYLRVNERSGLTSRGFLVQPGVVDCDYTGEIFVIMFNSTRQFLHLDKNARIAQLVPELYTQYCQIREVGVLSPSGSRGSQGFGSSGD